MRSRKRDGSAEVSSLAREGEDVPILRQLRVIYSDRALPVEASILIKLGHLYELKYRVDTLDRDAELPVLRED